MSEPTPVRPHDDEVSSIARCVVRRASSEDVTALVPVLTRAFADDPFICWALRKDARKDTASNRYFEVAMRRLTLPYGNCFTTLDLRGAALWVPPGRWRMGFLQQLALVPCLASAVGAARLPGVLGGTAAIATRHPREAHHYLFVLGVDPPVQGRGIGSALLAPVLRRCDRDGIPAYLETSRERNLGFYGRHGFLVTGEVRIPGGPLVWLMRREPRAPPSPSRRASSASPAAAASPRRGRAPRA